MEQPPAPHFYEQGNADGSIRKNQSQQQAVQYDDGGRHKVWGTIAKKLCRHSEILVDLRDVLTFFHARSPCTLA